MSEDAAQDKLVALAYATRKPMETTLAIDDDVLAAAREIADRQERSLGDVISDLARRSLPQRPALRTRNGIPLLPTRPGSPPVTLELVNELRDELL